MDQIFHIEPWMLLVSLGKNRSKITAIHVIENVPTVISNHKKSEMNLVGGP